MASTIRQQRVSHLLQHELSRLLEFELDDPRLSGLTVSAVEVSADLRDAKVFIVAVGNREKEVRQGLQHAMPFMRRELARRIQLRVVPALSFAFDRSIDNGERIERLLREVKDDLRPKETE